MNKFEKLIELNKEFDGMLIDDYTQALWYVDDEDCVVWNSDRILEDLLDGDGETCSSDCSRERPITSDGYKLIHCYTGFGDTSWLLFKLDNEVEQE